MAKKKEIEEIVISDSDDDVEIIDSRHRVISRNRNIREHVQEHTQEHWDATITDLDQKFKLTAKARTQMLFDVFSSVSAGANMTALDRFRKTFETKRKESGSGEG